MGIVEIWRLKMDSMATVISSIGLAGIIGVGIWVGNVNSRLKTVEDKLNDSLRDLSASVKELTKVVYELKGSLGK